MESGSIPIARLQGVSHRYGDSVALDRVDLTVPAGCVAGFIGPDGVGKSTLLGLIAGARKIQTGRVEVFGADARRGNVRAQMTQRIAKLVFSAIGLMLTITIHASASVICRNHFRSTAN